MRRIPLASVHPRPDARQIDPAVVKSLAESMGEVGLISPIRVRPVGEEYELCAGHHRREAAVELGWTEIDAIVEDVSDLDAELVMIDENLCRADLSPSDQAHFTARRKAIYLEKHPETAHGGDRKSDQVAKSATRSDEPETPRFTADTAKKTGKSERVIQLHTERGEKIAPGILTLIRGTHLDNGVYLDALKKLPHDQQRAKIEHDLKSEKKRRARAHKKPTLSAPEQLDDEDVEEKQFAALMSAWNRAGPEARERFREEIDRPVMNVAEERDGIPAFLDRRGAT